MGGYDFVYSLGFIEHFEDYLDVIMEHDKILKDNGILVITTPNFRGRVQYLAHKFFDEDNLRNHVLKSMNPSEWAAMLKEKNYEILFAGYFGGFDFWVEPKKRSFFKKGLLRLFVYLAGFLRTRVKQDRESCAPYCGLIAIKKAEK